MTLSVCVFLNGRQIAEATATNISNLAPVSDYDVTISENPSPLAPGHYGIYRIEGHKREQSVWALVREFAACVEEPVEP